MVSKRKLPSCMMANPASVYAIRSYSYLFAEFKDLKTEVISVKSSRETLHVPDNKHMKEFMKRHFAKTGYTVLRGKPEVEIVKHLKGNDQFLLLVPGAYNRGNGFPVVQPRPGRYTDGGDK